MSTRAAAQGGGGAEPPEELGLTDTEKGLWHAFRTGSMYDLRERDPAHDDPAGLHTWGPERTVRAVLVALLLLDGPPAAPGRVSAIKINGARLTGKLDLSGGNVTPYLELRNCRFEEEVLLPECRVTTARFIACAIPRFEGARLQAEGDLHLPRCTIDSGVRLTDARIGTDLQISQLTVRPDRRGQALAADGITVGQDLTAELLQSYGQVSLRGASIGVSLNLAGSMLRNPYGRRALNAPQLTVERSFHLTPARLRVAPLGEQTPPFGTGSRNFECHGGVRLDDGRFGGMVDFKDARFVMDEDQEISLRRIQTPELRFTGKPPEGGRVVLSGAKVGNLADTYASWPSPGRLQMAGFAYEHLIPTDRFPIAERLEWVAAATAEYSPEPYEQLANVLRRSGEDHDARRVLLAKHRRERETLGPAGKAWGYLQDWAVAYGYRPTRAMLWMAVLWALGTFFFSQVEAQATQKDSDARFNSALYALDILLPVIDLGQETAWQQRGAAQWVSALFVLAGWTLATTVAAGASRLLRRQ
ncbi:oxidoreductase [Streptomyces sp. A7024]|uniref:Oxidoreductase n=1 Tax=Streptomyces coryli TaxID=1128680 RepID=A0A6G4U3A9_9ACTN|nr:oxidoreductase [Streptomyces coryli]